MFIHHRLCVKTKTKIVILNVCYSTVKFLFFFELEFGSKFKFLCIERGEIKEEGSESFLLFLIKEKHLENNQKYSENDNFQN